MEVILKKAKLSISLMKQVQTANTSQLIIDDVIGYCIFDKCRWIVFHNPTIGSLNKYKLSYTAEALTENLTHFSVRVNFGYNTMSSIYDLKSAEEAKEFANKMNAIKQRALELGQFYL